jgi:hypothetical protein
VDWIYLAQDKNQYQILVNTNEPLASIKGGTFLDQLSDYKLFTEELDT